MSFNFGQNIPVGSVFTEIMIRFSGPSWTQIFVQEICQEDRNLKKYNQSQNIITETHTVHRPLVFTLSLRATLILRGFWAFENAK